MAPTPAATTIHRRVSYILPSPNEPPPYLSLPSLDQPRRAHPSPFFIPKSKSNGSTPAFNSRNPFASPDDDPPSTAPAPTGRQNQPKHCLGVTSLALDTSTLLENHQSPGGILYSGARDGLVCSWELNIPHKRRRGGRYELLPGRGSRVKWEKIGDGAEFFEEDEDEFDEDDEHSGERDRDRDGDSSDEEDEAVNGKSRGEVPYEDRWEVDAESLAYKKPPDTTFRQSAQTHTDWVNALLLCNLNQTVITASSDRTIRAWSPHAATDEAGLSPTLLGTHRDYVRSLAWAKHPSLLFSGSLDRRLSIWDVQSPHPDSPIFSINMDVIEDYGGVGMEGERGSVYSLGTDPAGQILAAGTPERVIRLWDPRSGDRSVGKLIGHSDCVRSVIVSEDGRYLLSGSSDTTVKLWSLAAHRCIHTFNHHTSSVWSLFSNHPNLERFYSGSRDGLICAVDVEQVTDIADGECVVLGREAPPHAAGNAQESKAGDEGIRAIVAMDDEYVWTATGSADIKRWRDTGRRINRVQNSYEGASYGDRNGNGYSAPTGMAGLSQPFSQAQPEGIRNKRLSLDGEADGLVRVDSFENRSVAFAPPPRINGSGTVEHGPPGSNTASPARDRLGVPAIRRTTASGEPIATSIATSVLSDMSTHDHEHDQSNGDEPGTLNGLPYSSLVCLGMADSPYSFGFRGGNDPLSRASIDSTRKGTLLAPDGVVGSPRKASAQADTPAQQAEAARRRYEDREIASEATPLRKKADAIIAGRPGLVRSLMLNDRQHVLTVDTEGEVAAWNVIKGVCIGRFSAAEVAAALDLERGVEAGAAIRKHSNEVLEMVKHRVEGETMVITWCQVDTRIGSLVVHLEEGRAFDAEVYADELGLDVDGIKEDMRVNLGKWALANLFQGLIKAEERELNSSPATSTAPSITRSPAPTHISLDRPNTTGRRARALSSLSQTSSLNILGVATPAATPALLPDIECPLSRSAPSNFQSFHSFRNGPLSAIPQSPGPNSLGASLTAGTSSPQPIDTRGDYFSMRKRVDSSPNRETSGKEPPPTPGGTGSGAGGGTGGTGSGATNEKAPPGQTPAPATPGGKMMGKFKVFGKKKEKETVMSPVVENEPLVVEEDTGPKMSDRDKQQLQILDTVRSHPFRPPGPYDAPPVDFPPTTALLISEESKDAGAWVVTYRSQVTSTDKDLEAIENNSPLWLLDYLFTSRTKVKDPVKLTFILEPVAGCGLKDMPEGTNRLSASRILRARKVMAFIFEKLELGSSRGRSSSIVSLHSRIMPNPRKTSNALPIPVPGLSGPRGSISAGSTGGASATGGEDELVFPEDAIELVCGDQVVDPRITLATLKQYYGSGGDMLLHYRPRKGVVVQ